MIFNSPAGQNPVGEHGHERLAADDEAGKRMIRFDHAYEEFEVRRRRRV